ncbi:hypothetical protein [Rhodovulum adriaticum]|uniref:hypothetical protein n=1 Tax=Rhodovulum adriaticum TaxID=35804 RepID=UPI0019064D49|nr:hypothetical protein [Rhodovulum adriaticum]
MPMLFCSSSQIRPQPSSVILFARIFSVLDVAKTCHAGPCRRVKPPRDSPKRDRIRQAAIAKPKAHAQWHALAVANYRTIRTAACGPGLEDVETPFRHDIGLLHKAVNPRHPNLKCSI